MDFFVDSRLRFLESLRNRITFCSLSFLHSTSPDCFAVTIIEPHFYARQFRRNVCSIKSERGLCRRQANADFPPLIDFLVAYRRQLVPPSRLLGLRSYGFLF